MFFRFFFSRYPLVPFLLCPCRIPRRSRSALGPAGKPVRSCPRPPAGRRLARSRTHHVSSMRCAGASSRSWAMGSDQDAAGCRQRSICTKRIFLILPPLFFFFFFFHWFQGCEKEIRWSSNSLAGPPRERERERGSKVHVCDMSSPSGRLADMQHKQRRLPATRFSPLGFSTRQLAVAVRLSGTRLSRDGFALTLPCHCFEGGWLGRRYVRCLSGCLGGPLFPPGLSSRHQYAHGVLEKRTIPCFDTDSACTLQGHVNAADGAGGLQQTSSSSSIRISISRHRVEETHSEEFFL